MKVHPEFSVYKHLPLAILVDFDGTITTRDIGDQIVINFAEPGWEKAMDRFRVGELNVRELWAIEIGMLREEREPAAIARAIEIGLIREGFGDLVSHCHSNNIPVEVASSGMHFYVDAILDANGFGELPRARPEVTYTADGFGLLGMPEGLRDCGMTAMCKCDRAWRLRRRGYRVMFVGDGVSDECVVSQADIVLATSNLREVCEAKGIAHTPFETFHEVLRAVELRDG
ncbi:MAG: hypothetical protein FI720_05210 [SAR202 cluster bacterium]|jgi:2,3-diketo-5-methylthio-1-phosphopentane phosphatase|nr:hypothetical protein [Dehalococcoidia bacterium]MEE2840820.1 haloacid dehalogenase-like hydrolase [Chloroflexota bacterium]MQG30228.1 hypothetical protein [SAR202 cluster bacterium]HAG56316.1 hypothetical protein [Dehalococcoidia bacterium]